mmetsp:Transcript_7449/g.19085  ORF Transcript_7449/g.19085 Transcript_7449/m.19085 type:complete len:231 (-) Transcript_7449:38-730(-)|eukprot:CAMPEP_0174926668 /NCGR_PEP_ID=MMETSP1355-20121228/13312_1 /TAXON_ID=464990 /ORGANISM="Hemiselmis tepida, Strain CCMP443" /LENGTH=230 /DNA_ID=CAMNT_0016172723 /DNA_START=250 /DNA_END=942 /DNA_ORIENTATION=-
MGCAQSNVQAAGPADKLVPQDLPPPKEQKAAAGGGDAKAADKVKVGVNVDCPGTHASSQETSRINSGGTHGESSRRAIPQAERRPSWSAGGNSMTAGTMEVGYIGTKNSEGLMHGKGTMWFEDGATYDGEWENGKMSGRGMMTYEDGATYDGEWLEDEMSGKGKYTFPSGAVYQGAYKDGERNGFGKFDYGTGDFYEGDFKDGLMHGRGKYTYSNGEVEDGQWAKGDFVG